MNTKLHIILVVSTIFFVFKATAQYKSGPCNEGSGFKDQTCVIKELSSSDKFNAADVLALKAAVLKNPDKSWIDIIDHDQTLISSLNDAKSTIKNKSDLEKFNKIILGFQLNPKISADDIPELLDLVVLFLKHNPSESFYFNNPSKAVVDLSVAKLNGKKAEIATQKKKCVVNQKIYEQLIDKRASCLRESSESENELNLYNALAELMACEDYNITEIGLEETARTRSIKPVAEQPKKCPISLGDVSASISLGNINLKMNGEIKTLSFSAGHDLTGKRNNLQFWRDQFEPQMQELMSSKGSGSSADGARANKSGYKQ